MGDSKLAKNNDYGKVEWNDKIPDKIYFDEMFRISKNQIIFGMNYFIKYLNNTSCVIVWDKDNGDNDFADCELAWTSFKTAVRKFRYRWHGMLQEDMKHREKRVHPTQKPVGLFNQILSRYAERGQIIFDPFMGSGTTAIACRQLGMNFIGVEREEKYYNLILENLKDCTQFDVEI